MKHSIFISALFLGYCFPTVIVEAAPDADSLVVISKKLDGDISHIHTGGSWSLNGKTGHHRIIAYTGGYEHIRSTLHLQWLAPDPKTKKHTVTKTVQIRECDKLVGFIVKSLKIEQIDEAYYALIDYRTKEYKGEAERGSIVEWKDAKMKIQLGTPSVYTIK